MMKIIVTTTLLILLAANQSHATDYCDARICDDDESHIGCDNDGVSPLSLPNCLLDSSSLMIRPLAELR